MSDLFNEGIGRERSLRRDNVVLIIDDDPTQRLLASAYLEAAGFAILEADGGEDGIEKARGTEPNLIILDAMMPEIDGFEVCRRIRSDSHLRHTPVLMVTGLNDEAAIKGAFEAGATDFMAKPIVETLLIYRAKFLLRMCKVEEDLREALEQADISSRAKAAFLANMSHEFRTPLNAILGFSDTIRARVFGPLGSDRYSQYIDDIHQSGVHLLGIVNNALDLSKIDLGEMKLREEIVVIRQLVQTALKQVSSSANRASITFKISIDVGATRLNADEGRLRQILINLLSNAVKFSHENGVVQLIVRPLRTGEISFVIRDNGIGMNSTEIPRIMRPFYQVDDLFNRRYDGAGLGVSIAYMLAELHGGSLSYDSQLGSGTTVTLTLPANRLLHRRCLRRQPAMADPAVSRERPLSAGRPVRWQ